MAMSLTSIAGQAQDSAAIEGLPEAEALAMGDEGRASELDVAPAGRSIVAGEGEEPFVDDCDGRSM
jgi:hypothetical protein